MTKKANKEMTLAQIAAAAEAASIWRPASVADEPCTQLTCWTVRRVNADFEGRGATIHFVGYTAYGEGRVSSPITTFDTRSRRGTSRSGRVYELVGDPGGHVDAEYVWSWWIGANGSPEWTDVTDEYVGGKK